MSCVVSIFLYGVSDLVLITPQSVELRYSNLPTLIYKQTLNYLAKKAKWLNSVVSTYLCYLLCIYYICSYHDTCPLYVTW